LLLMTNWASRHVPRRVVPVGCPSKSSRERGGAPSAAGAYDWSVKCAIALIGLVRVRKRDLRAPRGVPVACPASNDSPQASPSGRDMQAREEEIEAARRRLTLLS